MIDTALALYEARLAQSRLDNWPDVWAAHYAVDHLLGEVAAKVLPGGEVKGVFRVLIPFSYSASVTSSFVIFESTIAPAPDSLDLRRVLYVTRIHFDGESMISTPWIVGYRITDHGVRLYDKPEQSQFFVPQLFECIGAMMDRRLTSALYTFEEAMAAAIRGDDGFTDV